MNVLVIWIQFKGGGRYYRVQREAWMIDCLLSTENGGPKGKHGLLPILDLRSFRPMGSHQHQMNGKIGKGSSYCELGLSPKFHRDGADLCRVGSGVDRLLIVAVTVIDQDHQDSGHRWIERNIVLNP